MITIYLAPIRGITDSIWRSAMAEHFGGIDLSIAPFVRLGTESARAGAFRDLAPEKNGPLTVIPQVLGNNPAHFLLAASRLADLGYSHINWNLGCPFPTALKKSQGAGLLAYPDKILAFLDQVLPKLAQQLSIKTRLGVNEPGDLAKLIPRFNAYPLGEIIIHPRTASQMYEGQIDLDRFADALNLSTHPIVYNGDITTAEEAEELAGRFEKVSGWMIGRGMLTNPTLGVEIKTGKKFTQKERLSKIKLFHEDVYSKYRKDLSGPAHFLDKMKGIWNYLGHSIGADRKFFKRLRKVKKIGDYDALIGEALASNLLDC